MYKDKVMAMAANLVGHSVALEPGENLLIETFNGGFELAEALIERAQAVGARPFLHIHQNRMLRTLLKNASREQLQLTAQYEVARMKDMHAYIAIRAFENDSELTDVPADKMQMYQTEYSKPLHTDIRLKDTKWCVMGYPTPAFAQKAGMSTEAFEDFYFDVCGLDYKRLGDRMEALVAYMNKTSKVRLVAKNTDITFSIEGFPAVKCYGRRNIPDGEVYVGPTPGTANGYITYNVPCNYEGFVAENVRFTFENGMIVGCDGNDPDRIRAVLDRDEGARRLGEFAIGVNPRITRPIVNTLFDEKMTGSLHLTPGNAYLASNNGNVSGVHWDLVQLHTPEYGGGEIWFDDILIRKDGLFVVDELMGLNPENLL
ncbi:aminopeptidase [Eubacteriales bacterium OttesenSCG-928-A19]|nr:aminopeptidase [Eubacteriales bacterium OttesenSCG-928-A19]